MVGSTFAGTQPDACVRRPRQGPYDQGDDDLHHVEPQRPLIPCSHYNTNWAVNLNTDVYLVVAKALVTPGIAGMSCGILYDNALAPVWTCSVGRSAPTSSSPTENRRCPPDLPPCEWPISGGGNRITWVMTTNCQRTVIGPDGVHAVAEAFYLYAYSPDVFQITPNLNLQIPELAVADCAASTTLYDLAGPSASRVWVRSPSAFSWRGLRHPCNPATDNCAPVPVQNTTWGRVKTQY